jgi:hypothetical protein
MLQLIIASLQAILQVMTVVTLGFIFAKTGYFTMDKQKVMKKMYEFMVGSHKENSIFDEKMLVAVET